MNALLTFQKDVTDQNTQNGRSPISTTGKKVKPVSISTTAAAMNRDRGTPSTQKELTPATEVQTGYGPARRYSDLYECET
jgi:hypothetical protein